MGLINNSDNSTVIQKRNYRNVLIDGVGVSIASIAGPFLPVFLTRLGAFLIVCTMLTAIKLLWPAFFGPAGMGFPLACLGGALALLIGGGGQASVDRMIRGRR